MFCVSGSQPVVEGPPVQDHRRGRGRGQEVPNIQSYSTNISQNASVPTPLIMFNTRFIDPEEQLMLTALFSLNLYSDLL